MKNGQWSIQLDVSRNQALTSFWQSYGDATGSETRIETLDQTEAHACLKRRRSISAHPAEMHSRREVAECASTCETRPTRPVSQCRTSRRDVHREWLLWTVS